ncbi:hypothetical protein, partial [Paraburkholderia fungorum]|uniref:hypothetical protein n=1 Tax=Paraburkholderia fungorum TaxID=134537 RepID=UPI001ABFC82A
EAKDVEFPDPATMGAAESANSAQSGYQVNSIGVKPETRSAGYLSQRCSGDSHVSQSRRSIDHVARGLCKLPLTPLQRFDEPGPQELGRG